MSFSNPLKFTNAGREVQLQALSGKALIFTTVRMGDGELSSAISVMTSLVNERAAVIVNSVATNSKYATIEAIFKNTDFSEGFYWRELGVYVADPADPDNRDADILYSYQNAGELAEYINSPDTSVIEKIIRIPVFVGDVSDVSVNVNSIVQQDATVTQTEESTVEDEDFLTFYDISEIKNKKISFNNIKEKIIKNLATNLTSHLANKTNPHSVTASQVGLGKVPNVATNDQTPTYTEASSLANLVSGEKLSVAFGKIKKAITDLIAHLSNKTNPHSVTYTQTGAAAENHDHEDYLKSIAVYYSSNMSADDLVVPFALIPASNNENAELFNIIGSNFVYVMTLFYGKRSVDSRRFQLAFNYSSSTSRIATRHVYADGWTPWKAVTNDYKNPLTIDSGGTGATTVADVLKNLGLSTIKTDVTTHLANKSNPHSVTASQVGAAAKSHSHSELIPKQAVYYPASVSPDIDTITDGLMLIPIAFSKDCPVGGSFVYIRQNFYDGENESNLRTQVAFPYGINTSLLGSGIATRMHLGKGVWTEWEKVGEIITEDISKSFLSEVISGCTVTSKSVYKYGNVISGTITFNYTPADDEVFVNLFEISQTYRPKTDIIQVQLSLKREEEVLFPTSIAYFDTGSFTMNAMGMTYDSGLVSFCYICN